MDVSDMYKLVSKAFDYSVSDPGTYTVYHYTSPDGLMGIFKKDVPKLYFSQYDSLNDCKERFDITEYIYGYCDYQVKEKKMSQELCDAIKNITLSDIFPITTRVEESIELANGDKIGNVTAMSNKDCYTYICSFSLEEDLLPMWRMYSKSEQYEGFCIGIFNEVFRQSSSFEKGYSIELRKTIYSDIEKRMLVDKLLLPVCEHYESSTEREKREWLSLIELFIYENQFIFKNKAFEYEKEVRAILHIPKEQTIAFENISERKYRQSNGMIVPYVEFELPQKCIYQINLAPNIKEEIAGRNLKDFLESKGYDIRIYPSNVPIRGM